MAALECLQPHRFRRRFQVIRWVLLTIALRSLEYNSANTIECSRVLGLVVVTGGCLRPRRRSRPWAGDIADLVTATDDIRESARVPDDGHTWELACYRPVLPGSFRRHVEGSVYYRTRRPNCGAGVVAAAVNPNQLALVRFASAFANETEKWSVVEE